MMCERSFFSSTSTCGAGENENADVGEDASELCLRAFPLPPGEEEEENEPGVLVMWSAGISLLSPVSRTPAPSSASASASYAANYLEGDCIIFLRRWETGPEVANPRA